MRRLDISRNALKFVHDLAAKQYKQVVSRVFELMREPKPADCRAVVGLELWRVTVGEYRIIYSFTQDTLFVEAIGKRNDDEVYRRLKR